MFQDGLYAYIIEREREASVKNLIATRSGRDNCNNHASNVKLT